MNQDNTDEKGRPMTYWGGLVNYVPPLDAAREVFRITADKKLIFADDVTPRDIALAIEAAFNNLKEKV